MHTNNVKNVERAEKFRSLLTKEDVEPLDLLEKEIMELPDFTDHEKIKSAQLTFRRNYYAMMFCMYMGLLSILAIPSMLNVLVHTKKSSSVVAAYKRYMRTIYHTLVWFRNDIKPGTDAWKSLENVRKVHFSASKSAKIADVGMITQKDMAITQYGFMGFVVLSRVEAGVQCEQKKIEDFCHFWRVLGSLLGLKNEYNLCCESFEETIERLDVVRSEVLVPNLQEPPENFTSMTKFIVKGLWCFNPFDPYREIIFMIKRLVGVPGFCYLNSEIPPEFNRNNLEIYKQTRTTRLFIWLSVMSRQFLLKFFVFRWSWNIFTWIAEFFIRYFPVLAFFRIGFRNSYVDIR